MITLNNIVTDYSIFNKHKNKTGQISFRDNDHQDLTINNLFIPGKNFSRETGRTWLHSLYNIQPADPLPIKEGLREVSGIKRELKKRTCRIYKVEEEKLSFMADFAENVDKIPYFNNRKLFKILNNGIYSVAIDIGKNPKTNENEVLKISSEPNYPDALERRFEPVFDMPVFKQGKVDGLYYCVQAKGTKEGLTPRSVRQVGLRIENKGYKLGDDFDEIQVMMYKGQPYLVDPACAELV